jgi:hypothetical protein
LVIITQAGQTAVLTVDRNTVNVPANAGNTGIAVTANVSWSVVSNDPWLTINGGSGSGNGNFQINYANNPNVNSRTGTVTVTGSGGVSPQIITVIQAGVQAVLTVDKTNINVNPPAGTENFTITSNVSWTITGVPAWFTLSASNGSGNQTININYQQNVLTTSRSATLTISSGGLVPDRTVVVTQAGAQAVLDVDKTAINVTAPAGTANFAITANVNWTITGTPTWFTLSASSGAGNQNITINYQQNSNTTPRSATLTIAGGGLPNKTIVVTQQGTVAAFLTIQGQANRNVTSVAGSEIFNISSNVNWTVTVDVPWVTLAPASGSNNGLFVASYSNNPNSTVRVARITVRGVGVPDQIATITQAGFTAALSVSPLHYDVGPDAGSVSFALTANVAWTANVDVPWVSVTPNFGNGNASITANYQRNPAPTIRTATVTFTAGGLSPVTVTITQSEGTATVDLEKIYRVQLMPNPAKEVLNIEFEMPESQLLRFDVLSINGSILSNIAEDVFAAGSQRLDAEVSHLPNGVYLLRLQSSEGVLVKRFLVGR